MTATERQRRHRQRFRAEFAQERAGLVRSHRQETELLREAERAEHGDLSSEQRIALADRLADMVMDYLRRAQALSKRAMRVRAGRGR